MRVAVTGGAGFIGSNLVCHLLREGAEVTVLDDFSTGRHANLKGCDAAVVEGSILDLEALDEVIDGVDAVVHLAARPSVPRSLQDPLASHHANATGTVMVLEAARRAGGPHVVLASSSSVYGSNPALPKREGLCPMPLSPYAASKLAGESYGAAYAECFGVPVLVFRFFNVYGPRQAVGHAYAAVVPAFVSAALSGVDLVIHGDGRQTRDFTYVGSVTAALSGAIHGQITSEQPVNLAFGTRANLLDVITELETIIGRPVGRRHVDPRPGDVRDSQADNTLLRALIPSAEAVSLHVGLAETVAWYRSEAQRWK